MRRSMLARVGSMVIATSMVMVPPVSAERLSERAMTVPGQGAVVAAVTTEDLMHCLDDPAEPAFVTCTLADGKKRALFWTGWEFIEASAFLKAIASTLGVDWKTVFGAIMTMSPSEQSTTLEMLSFLMLLGFFGEVPTVEQSTAPQPPAELPLMPGEQAASSPVNPLTIAPSLNYRLAWSMGSSICGFDGKLTGGLDEWTYSGHTFTAEEGDRDSCSPARNSDPGGTATCTLSGVPVADLPATGVSMECRAGLIDRYGAKLDWETDFRGTLAPYIISNEVAGVTYSGAAVENWITVTLEPCAPGKIC